MTRKLPLAVLTICLFAAAASPLPEKGGPFGCTIVMAARDGLVLAGNNEDRDHPRTIVMFVPATEKYFGRIVFGYDDSPFQGGMNDRGLFIDGNALRPTGWTPVPGKPSFPGIVISYVLGTCATCEDVRAFFERYNVPGLARARFPVADKTGASMVVEYGKGRVRFVRSGTWYQIATNFVMSEVEDGRYPCWRYRAADKILSEAETLSVELVRSALEKTRQTGGSRTVYSNIYDLKNGVVLTYNLGNFDEAVTMNLEEELRKGGRRLDLGSLFEGSAAAGPPGPESIPVLADVLEKYVEALGGREAIEKVMTRRLTGKLTHEFPGQGRDPMILPAEVVAAGPDMWRLILRTSNGVQQMGFDGERGWLQDADRILIDDRQARSRLAYLFHPRAVLRLGDYFAGLELAEPVRSGAHREFAVKAAGRDGQGLTLYFDEETGFLNRLGDDVVVKAYRREAGVHHPVEIEITRRGMTSTYVFENVEVNGPLAEDRFAVPVLDEVFPEAFDGLPEAPVLPLLKDFPSEHEDMNVPCRDGRFLHDLVVRKGYKRGLEIGTFTGYSALWLGWAFEKAGGTLVTIEIDREPGEKARKNVAAAGLQDSVDVRIADAFAEIPRIEGEFDFIFIDAWKPDYVRFLKLIRDRVPAGGVIVAHNVTNYARDMKDFLDAIRSDPGLETTFEELSGEGMSVSFVRGLRRVPAHPGKESAGLRFADSAAAAGNGFSF